MFEILLEDFILSDSYRFYRRVSEDIVESIEVSSEDRAIEVEISRHLVIEILE